MKSLHSKLHECSLCEYKLYEGFYKNAGGMVRPSTKEELRNEIEIRLDRGQYNLNDIDTSKITNMGGLFARFNQNRNLSKIDISGWDTSSVVDMSYMFADCYYFNSDLSRWDVSNVRDMNCMFFSCADFNCDLSKWNVSNVENMRSMFYECIKFNSDLSKWNTSNVTDMNSMFEGCSKFNCDLSKWDVRNVRDMKYLFQDCSNFSADLSNWKVDKQVELFNTFNRSSAEEPRWYHKGLSRRENEAFNL